MAEQGVSVVCEGGLDKVGTTHTLFRTPGVATELTAHGDTVVFPKQYSTVLLARARYYMHQFKDNISQAQLADAEYKKGLRTMREQLIEPFPDSMVDDRTAIV